MSSINIVFGAVSGPFSGRVRTAYISVCRCPLDQKEPAAVIIDTANKPAAADFFRATKETNPTIRFTEVPQ